MPRGGKTVAMMKEIHGLSRGMASMYHPVEVLQAYVGQLNGSSCQRIPGMYENTGHKKKRAVGSLVIKQEGGREFEVLYPWQLILYANCLQRWHIASFFACFCILQLANVLLHKSILLLEASNLSESDTIMRGVSNSNDELVASWQLCLSKRASAKSVEGYREGNSFVGQGCLQEAWEDAEHYLNEVINNDGQGAYFSYNCIIPHQDRQESVSGSWNRNHVGRLIRQLWPVND